MSSLRYRPHIDGLRAVAVLMVILHHLGDWAGLRGGYVGVDVFFVISGYLITSIVKSDVEAGRFSFGDFYRRRVIRLAPAYFTVLFVTSMAALVWMLPAELLAYVRSAIASSLFLANFHMWKEIGGYFGADAATAPLLHLWSLAVEEQFYLFWPCALLLGHRLLGHKRMPWIVAAIAIGGAVASQWGVERYPAASYYLLPTRFFELAVGAFLAYFPSKGGDKRFASVCSVSGIALIAYSAFSYWKETPFPGYAAIAPVLGTAMLLRWGEETIVGSILGSAPAILIGRISYPAYLWHWPILAFLHINEVDISLWVGVVVLVSTMALSWATWRGLELPARRFLQRPTRTVVLAGAGVPIAVSILIACGITAMHGLPGRFPDSLNRKSEALLAFPNKARGRCNEGPPTHPLPPEDCVLGRQGGKVDFLLVGDSHANHFSGFFDELGRAADMRGYDMTRSNTPYLPGVDRWSIRNGVEDHHENFVPRNEYISRLLETEKYKTIVLAGNYSGFFNDEIIRSETSEGAVALEEGLRAAIINAKNSAAHVVVVETIPLLESGLYDCSLRSERFGKKIDCDMSAALYRKETQDVRSMFGKLESQFPDVVWIKPEKILCDKKRCLTDIDGIPLYRDHGHLNDIGSRLLARKWLARYGNPLKFENQGQTAPRH